MKLAESDRLILLGTGTAVPTRERGPTGELLVVGDDVTAIDPGPGSLKRAFDAGFPPWTIRRVLLTHHHVDHMLDLVALLFARVNPFLDPPSPLAGLVILGGPGTAALVDGIGALFGPGLLRGDRSVRGKDEPGTDVRVEELRAGAFDLGIPGTAAEAFAVAHSAASLAYRITLRSGVVVAISGDTGDDPGAVAVAKDADHYLLEAALTEDRRVVGHVTAREAGTIAARAGCRHLILNHFYPQVDPEIAAREASRAFRGRITIGRDGWVVPLVAVGSEPPTCG